MEEYRRWDQVRVSDHRPVSGHLRLRVKTVDGKKRAKTYELCMAAFADVNQRVARAAW